MGNYQTGSNNGVTGLVNITGLTAFTAAVFGFNRDITAQTQNFPGRGDDEWGDMRLTGAGGVLIVQGFAKPEKGFAIPNSFKGVTGTIDLQYSATSGGTITKETVSVLVYSHKVGTRKNETDEWPLTIACAIRAHPTEANFHGTQTTPTYPTYSDKVLYDGIVKRYDPNNLTDGGTQAYLLWGVTDSDAAERSKILTVLATALDPLSRSLKVRDVALGRINFTACRATVTWGLTSTKDDVLLPLNTYVNDDHFIQDIANTAAINAVAPDPPALANAFVLRGRTTRKLHDNATLNMANWGMLSTDEDITFPKTYRDTDPSDLKTVEFQSYVYAFSQPTPAANVPANMRLRGTRIVNINRVEKEVFYTLGKDSTKEEWQQSNSFVINDPFTLESTAQVALVDAVPSTILSGFTYRKTRIVAITHDHNGYIAEFGQRSTIGDHEMPGSPKETDVSHIKDKARRTKVTTSPTPPPAPPVPVGSDGVALGQLVRVGWQQLDDGNYEHFWDFANTTSLQEIVFAKAKFNVDPAGLDDYEWIPVTATSPTAGTAPTPTNTSLKQIGYEAERVAGTPVQWVQIFKFAHNTSQDDIETRGTNTKRDPNHIDETAEITQVHATANPPATPPAPLGSLNHVDTQAEKAANGAYTGRWSTTWKFDSTTNLQKITNKGDIDEDVAALKAEDTQTLFSNVASPAPPDPTTRVPNTKIIRRVARRVVGTPPGWEHIYYYGYWDEKDKIEAAGTWRKLDPLTIESESKDTIVAKAQPLDPAMPVGLKIVRRDNSPLPNGFNEYGFQGGKLSSIEKIKLPKIRTKFDPNQIDDDAVRCREYFNGTPAPALPLDPPPNNVKEITHTDFEITPDVNGAPGVNLRVWLYGAKDSVDELVLPQYLTDIDVSGLESRAIRAALDNPTPIVDPVLTSANLVYTNTRTKQITLNLPNSNHILYVFVYELLTNKRKAEIQPTRVIVSPLIIYKRRIATVFPVSGTIEAMGTAILAANIADKTFEQAALELLNDQQARKIIQTTGDDKLIHSGSWHTNLESMRGRPPSNSWHTDGSFGIPTCVVHFIAPGPPTGGFFTVGNVIPIESYVTRGRFLYRRRFITATPETYDFPGSIGTVNSAAFLGYGAHFIMYSGVIRQHCYGNASASLLVNDYVFQFNSERWVNCQNLPFGRVHIEQPPGLPSSGYYSPNFFELTNSGLVWPSPTQFDVFTSAA